VLSTPVLKALYGKIRNAKYAVIFESAFAIIIMLLCAAALVSESYNPFIYFRF